MVNDNNDLKAAAANAVAAVQNGIKRVPMERRQFRALIVSNPNDFGNLKLSPFPAVPNIVDPCGYVIRMDVSDRTIVSGGSGWHDYASVG